MVRVMSMFRFEKAPLSSWSCEADSSRARPSEIRKDSSEFSPSWPKRCEWYFRGYVLYSFSVEGRYQMMDRMSLSLTGTKRKICPKLLAS